VLTAPRSLAGGDGIEKAEYAKANASQGNRQRMIFADTDQQNEISD
jgi:hypothetical protein